MTYHKSINYGAYLQSYALLNFMREKGYDAEIIDFNMKKAEKMYKKSMLMNMSIRRTFSKIAQFRVFRKAQKDLKLSEISIVSDRVIDLREYVEDKYDCIIVGSDEVWKTDGFRGFPNPYWLIVDVDCIKVSYAVSARSDFSKLSEEHQILLKKAINDFKLVSVRDQYTCDEVARYYNAKVFLNCDPTFLYRFDIDSEKGKEQICAKCNIDRKLPILLIMSREKDTVRKLRRMYKGKFNLIGIYDYHPHIHNVGGVSPIEFVNIIAAADLLYTNFFHGMCFAMKANTSFIAVEKDKKGIRASKMYDLLDREGLTERFLSAYETDYFHKLIEKIKLYMGEKVNFIENVVREKAMSDAYFEELDRLLQREDEKRKRTG